MVDEGNTVTVTALSFPPRDDRVEMLDPRTDGGSFSGKLQNRKLERVRVSVVAGYRRSDGWVAGSFLGRRHIGETNIELNPGETRDVHLSFVRPILPAELAYHHEVTLKATHDPSRE